MASPRKSAGVAGPKSGPTQLLLAEDCVLGRLGDAEFDSAPGGDFDGLALLGTKLHGHRASRSIHQHELADSRDREGVLGILVSELGESSRAWTACFLVMPTCSASDAAICDLVSDFAIGAQGLGARALRFKQKPSKDTGILREYGIDLDCRPGNAAPHVASRVQLLRSQTVES